LGFSKVFKRLENGLETVVVSLFALFLAVIFLQVVMRYVFNASLTWSEELARYLFIWVLMLSVALAIRDNANMRVTFILDVIPWPFKGVVTVVISLLMIAFEAYLAYYGFSLAQKVFFDLSPAMRIPIGLAYLALPIGGLFMIIYSLIGLTKTVSILRREWEDGHVN